MIYFVIFFIICVGYHTFTYGMNVGKNEKNPLGGIAVILLSLLTMVGSIIFIIIRS